MTKLNKVYTTGNNEVPDEVCSTILEFLEYCLSTQKQQRGDYGELLGLTMISLGSIPKNGISFRTSEAVGHTTYKEL